MHLLELLALPAIKARAHASQGSRSVPDWMLGTFKRRSISFANGLTDTETLVFWLQSRNFSIDLRLPALEQQLPALPVEAMDADQLHTLAQYQGWFAQSCWDESSRQLSWQKAISLQLHNQWPEAAILSRIGNCLMEFAPSHSYVEDWRLQNRQPGPLIGLRLLAEYNLISGATRHQGGGLIINGNFAGLVLGRAPEISRQLQQHQLKQHQLQQHPLSLPQLVQQQRHDPAFLKALFHFETSLATGSLQQGFQIQLSTQPLRHQHSLCPLDGFEFRGEQQLQQKLLINGQPCVRLYWIDVLQSSAAYSPLTPSESSAQQWYTREQAWLSRYVQAVY